MKLNNKSVEIPKKGGWVCTIRGVLKILTKKEYKRYKKDSKC